MVKTSRFLLQLLAFAWVAGAIAASTDTPLSPAPGVQEVILVFKTHFDIGYTDMASNVVQRYRTTMMDQALKVVDQNRDLPPEQQFVWTIPGWPMKKILEDWPGQTPERKQRVLQALKDGRFVVHALPFTTHTELLELEDLVRGMGYSSAISRANNQPLATDAKMTDVPSHSWIIPTMLKHAGVNFLHLGCNAASSSPQVPRLFWWEGPDGSRLLTMYTAESYGTGVVPPKDWPCRTWLALIHTGDNHGPPTPEEVKEALDEAKVKLPGVKIRIGRLSDFGNAILAENPKLPTVRGDMTDTWIYGPMSDPAGVKLARNTRPLLAAAETLNTQSRIWGLPTPDATTALAEARENSLLYGEHTWGGAFSWIYGRYVMKFGQEWEQDRAAGKFQRIESSWDEHTTYIEKTHSSVNSLLQSEMTLLAQGVNVAGRRIVVFNPLPWKRSDIVSVPLKEPVASLTDVATGKRIPVGTAGGKICFLARNVPPNGYMTFIPGGPSATQTTRESPLSTDGVIENRYFRLTLDPSHGTMRSLIDKRSGCELVDAEAPQGFGQYLYERFDRDQVQAFVKSYVKIDAEWGTNELGKPSLPPASQVPYQGLSPKNFKVRCEQTPFSQQIIMTASASGSLPTPVATRLTLYRDLPWLDWEITVHDKPFQPWPEAGWMCLPFKVDEPAFHLGRLGSIVDPAKDIVAGCNFHQFALNGGLTVTDPAGRGVGLCPLDSPLVSLGEPGCWKYSKEFTSRQPRVYINLFNNQWTTNFRLWNAGTWSSRVRVWSVDGGDAEKTLVTPSEEARYPLVGIVADGPGGTLPAQQAGLQLSKRGIKVTAFFPDPVGKGFILRLWELAGRSGNCQVQLPAGIKAKQAQPLDLRDNPIGAPIQIRGGKFEVPIWEFAPASFKLETL